MSTFALDGHLFITLTNLLKLLRLTSSGGEANQLIDAGLVQVNGAVEQRKRRKLYAGDVVEFAGQRIEIA